MADLDNNTKPAGEKKDMPMERRLLLAFALMGAVLFGSQYLFEKLGLVQKPAAQKQSVQKQAPVEAKPDPAPEPAAAPPPRAPNANVVAAENETTTIVENDIYRVTFSNRGGVVRSWVLKKYKDSNGKPLEMVNAAADKTSGWPFSYLFPKGRPATDLNAVLFRVSQPDPLTVEFAYSDGRVEARKRWQFDPKVYRANFRSEVHENGQPFAHNLAWRGGFGDLTAHNAYATMKSVRYDIPKGKLVTEEGKFAEKGPVVEHGEFLFAGLEDAYFAQVAIPSAGTVSDFQIWGEKFTPPGTTDEVFLAGESFGGAGVNEWTQFVGPKNFDVMRAVNPKLEQMVDWGWFGFLAKPLFFSLHWTYDNLIRNWGWAIIFVTVIINFLMLPLKLSSLRSMQKMSAIQPEVNALNAKYKDVGLRDPRKQKQNEELMALYSKNGINPMGGCIPLILQMPFFFAFYSVLSTTIELRSASWLWIHDLAQPEPGLIKFLPIAMIGSQFWLQKMTPSTSPDPSQQKMMMLMPLIFGFMFYNAPSGLVLYWLTGNVVAVLQQLYFNKRVPLVAPAAAAKKK